MKQYFTYLLRFTDGSYYTGVTNNIQRRTHEHRTCMHPGSYVSRKGAFKLVHVESFTYVMDAIRREKQIKTWSRAKKDALVQQNSDSLILLARKHFNP